MQDFFPSDALDYWPQRRRVQNLHIKALLAREILLAAHLDDETQPARGICRHRESDGGEHRNVSRTVGKSARLRKINTLARGIYTNTARLFVLRQQGRKDSACGNVVFEFEPIANNLFDAEMQRDRADREIERSGDEDVAVPELGRCIDEGLSLRKNRRLQRHLKKVVGQPNEPVAVHPAICTKREDVE